MEEAALNVVCSLQETLEKINGLRSDPLFDGRSISIAATHLETAMLWVANARK